MSMLENTTPKGLQRFSMEELRNEINRALMQTDASPRDQVESLIDYALSTSITYKEEACSWTELRDQLLECVGQRFDRMVKVKESWRAAA